MLSSSIHAVTKGIRFWSFITESDKKLWNLPNLSRETADWEDNGGIKLLPNCTLISTSCFNWLDLKNKAVALVAYRIKELPSLAYKSFHLIFYHLLWPICHCHHPNATHQALSAQCLGLWCALCLNLVSCSSFRARWNLTSSGKLHFTTSDKWVAPSSDFHPHSFWPLVSIFYYF